MITKDETILPPAPVVFAFKTVTESQYNDIKFKDLLLDSDTSTKLTGRLGLLKTLQKIDSTIKINNSTAGSANFSFGIDNTTSLCYINLDIPIELLIFHIVSVHTLFVICLADLNKLSVLFNNVINELVYNKFINQKVYRYGYVFLMWHIATHSLIAKSPDVNLCYLIEVQLRCLHYRFGHRLVCCLEVVLY